MESKTERRSRRYASKRNPIKSLTRALKSSISDTPHHHTMDSQSIPNTASRAELVQKWLNENASELLVFGAQDLRYPLKFDLVRSGKHLSKSDLNACFHLIESTSSRDYKLSSIGWSPREKKQEMADEDMIYLLVRQGPMQDDLHQRTDDTITTPYPLPITPSSIDGNTTLDLIENQNPGAAEGSIPSAQKETPTAKPTRPELHKEGEIIGFISFMFTNDDPPYQAREVVYIYEIHLQKELRGHGLGSHLMKIVERAAKETSIGKIMLTVFSRNKQARALYERMGYSKDQCSPHDRSVRGRTIKADYVIMSKKID